MNRLIGKLLCKLGSHDNDWRSVDGHTVWFCRREVAPGVRRFQDRYKYGNLSPVTFEQLIDWTLYAEPLAGPVRHRRR